MDLITVFEKVLEFLKNPSFEGGILLTIIVSLAFYSFWKYLFKEEISIKNQKKEIFIALVASGFNEKTINILKKSIELCMNNEPRKFYNYVKVHMKELSFFKEYPTIFQKVSANSSVYANRDLRRSDDVFADIYYLGMHVSDLIAKGVLANLDTALYLTNEGERDLKSVNFYFDELITKAQTIDHFMQKLEVGSEFKKFRKLMSIQF